MGLGIPDDSPVYANNPVIIKSLPFNGQVRELQAGQLIIIDGFIPPKAKGLTVNLEHVQSSSKVDILLHVDVRLSQNAVVLNTQTLGRWEKEETIHGVGDLKVNKAMEIIILLHITGFKISLNGEHAASFKHRAPYRNINHLNIQGSAIVHSVTFQPGPRRVYAGTAMPLLPPHIDQSGAESQQKDRINKFPEVFGQMAPLQEFIPGGLTAGRFVYVCCLPNKSGQSFRINLSPNSATSRKDIALHVRVDLGRQKGMVLNSQERGQWGKEISPDCKHSFNRGVHSDVLIQCTPQSFMISVNNLHLTEFEHRIKRLETVSWLEVTGDVKIIHARLY